MTADPLVVRARALWDAFNQRDVDAVAGMVAEDFVNDAALPGTAPGAAGLVEVWQRLWNAFPDARFDVEVAARDGQTVVVIGTMEGTHEGVLMGVAASGRRVRWQMCHIGRVDD